MQLKLDKIWERKEINSITNKNHKRVEKYKYVGSK